MVQTERSDEIGHLQSAVAGDRGGVQARSKGTSLKVGLDSQGRMGVSRVLEVGGVVRPAAAPTELQREGADRELQGPGSRVWERRQGAIWL